MKNPLSAVKVGLALRKAGFEQVRVAGKRGYRVVMYTIEEVNRNVVPWDDSPRRRLKSSLHRPVAGWW